MSVDVNERLLRDLERLPDDVEGTPRERLERLLGADLARMLVAALSPRHTRRGGSSP